MCKIKCRMCGDEHNIKQFGMHITRKHKMKYEDYAKLYWEDLPNWSPCVLCGTVSKNVYCSKECTSIGLSKMRKGKTMPTRTEEHCRKISEAAKKRLSNPNNHPWIGRKHTEETKQKISKHQKEIYTDKTKHPLYGTTVSETTRKKISNSQKKYYETNDSPFKGKTHTPETIKKIFQNKPMNKLEKLVAEYLDGLGIKYTFQFFINSNGICKSYDFKLKNSNLILEVHGDYWHGGKGVERHVFNVNETIENDKLKKKIANDMGYEVVVVWESELKENIDIIKDKINL
jgi:G:T-mismatch repair DNA endonuclease (very short patch repair protein)